MHLGPVALPIMASMTSHEHGEKGGRGDEYRYAVHGVDGVVKYHSRIYDRGEAKLDKCVEIGNQRPERV